MASAGCVGSAWAVQGGVVAAGSGAINTQGNKTTITQTTDKMVVNWKSFDIGKKESVDIKQPGATSAVLNRVTTASPTQIDGSLTSNGRVFVINPAGVMFSKSAQVDVGSLVASTLNVNDDQFMNGGKAYFGGGKALNLYAVGGQGTVSNEGRLHAREAVVMLGANAINEGTISAKDVTLAAADGVAMQMDNSGFSVMLGRAAQHALAANYGTISATGGDVKLSAAATGAMLATVVRNTGTIEASRATTGQGGSIILGSELDGNISAGGRMTAERNISIVSSPAIYADPPFDQSTMPTGGYYGLTGHDVTVEAGAKLSAPQGRISIETGGGNVALNAPVLAANDVYVSANQQIVQNADIRASAGSVKLDGDAGIIEADGVKTVAADSVQLISRSYASIDGGNLVGGGPVRVANVSGKTVDISGGNVYLKGNVKADGDISVRAVGQLPRCLGGADVLCAAGVPPWYFAYIDQRSDVVSRNGSVTMTGRNIYQDASSTTRAGTDATLRAPMGKVETGTIKAGNSIMIDAQSSSLGGKLTARAIALPENTTNVEGNVRIKPSSTGL